MRVEISQISSKAFSHASLPVITRVIAAARKNTIFGTSNNITMTPISIKDLMYGATTSTTHPMNSLNGTVGARRELLLVIKQLEKLLPVQKMRM